VEWLLLGRDPRVAACVIYLHLVAFGAALLSGFWSLLNESFEPRSAKESFGRIAGMGTLGGLLGGVLAERIAAWFGPVDVVLALAVLHLACGGLLWGALRSRARATGQPAETARETSAIDAVHRYPFLLTLGGLVVAASSGAALLEFVFKAQAAQTIGRGTMLLRFFALYYTATSLLTFLLQTFLTRRVLQRAGIAATAGVLPATISLGGLAGLVFPGFPARSALFGIEILLRN